MNHSISDAQFRATLKPGTRVIVFDAWQREPRRAVFRKYLGSMAICETERGIVLQASPDRLWLADDLFGPVE